MVGRPNPVENRSDSAEGTRGVATFPLEPCALSDFLCTLFRHLDEYGIRYCVLHSWQKLPHELPSDLDLAVHPRDSYRLPFVVQRLLERGYRPVQCLNYAVGSFCFIFAWFEGLSLRTAAVDVILEHRQAGLILIPGKSLVARRHRKGLFWIPDPATEFTYLLSKKTLKGVLPPPHEQRFKHLVEGLGRSRAEEIAGELFGARSKGEVVEACVGGSLGDLLGKFRKQLWWRNVSRHPLNLVHNLLGDALRRLRRWCQPTGLLIVVLGPDGVGKTTTLTQLIEQCGPTFRRHRVFHWRPGVLGKMGESCGPPTVPHEDPPRGTLWSIAYMLGFFLDYWLGYGLVIRSLLARSTLVLFDRYFHDLLVDPLRYRYGGPVWLVRLLSRFVPPPDLVILVLDAPEEVILSRKREVPAQELRRQREGYRRLTISFARASLVKTDQGLERTVGEACHLLAEYLFERFQRRHASWLGRGEPARNRNRPEWAPQ